MVSQCQDLKCLSEDILKKQIEQWGLKDSLDYNGNQKHMLKIDHEKSRWTKYLKYSTDNDTIFLLQAYDVQGYIYLTVWNSTDTLSFCSGSSFERKIRDDDIVKKNYRVKYVGKWDIDKIKELEKENDSYLILPRLTYYATRVIFKKGIYLIDCIRFRNFVNPEKM